jgi:glycosyltransferase involved in cell wall biosynthesis
LSRARAKPDILLVSTADWDNPYWTNKQHVAVELNARGHRILYVESQGLRRPTATAKDFTRIVRRLRRAFAPPREVRPGLWVWSPLAIPLQQSAFYRGLNRALTQVGLGIWIRILRLRPEILWTYSPLTPAFYEVGAYDFSVYHAVDDIKAQPGMPREVIETAEHQLAQQCDVIFTTSEKLQASLSPLNANTFYFPNVADYRHFSSALDAELAAADDLAPLGKPCIGFIGAVSSYKLDMEMILQIAKRRPDWRFAFVGEIGEGDPLTRVDAFTGVANISFLGGRPYSQLPAYLKGFDVAIIPSLINEYTVSMFPMKFFEYLAAGKPVVATRLPALAEFAEYVHTADDAPAFEAAIEQALAGLGPPLGARLRLAEQHTYEARTTKMMQIVNARMGGK